MKFLKRFFDWFKKPRKIITEYRFLNSRYFGARAIQFKHADGTWRYIHGDSVSLVKGPLTQDNCPARENGHVFTIDTFCSLESGDGYLIRFAKRWPDIEDYMKHLRQIQERGKKKLESERSRPTVYFK